MPVARIGKRGGVAVLNFPNLDVMSITPEVADRAAALRGAYHLKTPDALQCAAALVAGADAFVSFDQDIVRVQPVLHAIVLRPDQS